MPIGKAIHPQDSHQKRNEYCPEQTPDITAIASSEPSFSIPSPVCQERCRTYPNRHWMEMCHLFGSSRSTDFLLPWLCPCVTVQLISCSPPSSHPSYEPDPGTELVVSSPKQLGDPTNGKRSRFSQTPSQRHEPHSPTHPHLLPTDPRRRRCRLLSTMSSKLVLLFASAALATPGHLKLDLSREYVRAAGLEEINLEEPLKLVIGGRVSQPSPATLSGQRIGGQEVE